MLSIEIIVIYFIFLWFVRDVLKINVFLWWSPMSHLESLTKNYGNFKKSSWKSSSSYSMLQTHQKTCCKFRSFFTILFRRKKAKIRKMVKIVDFPTIFVTDCRSMITNLSVLSNLNILNMSYVYIIHDIIGILTPHAYFIKYVICRNT